MHQRRIAEVLGSRIQGNFVIKDGAEVQCAMCTDTQIAACQWVAYYLTISATPLAAKCKGISEAAAESGIQSWA